MAPMNRQECFNKVWEHFVTNKQPRAIGQASVFGGELGPQCMYRAKDGAKCAFGVLIPDSAYRPEYEGRAGYWVMEHPAFPVNDIFTEDVTKPFITALQACHDCGYEYNGPPEEFTTKIEGYLKDMAKTYNITVPEPIKPIV